MGRARLARVAELLTLGGVVFSAFALGGAPSWVVAPLALMAGLGLVAASAAARREGRRLRWVPLAFLPLAMAGLCAVQLVPLPLGVLSALSPTAGELVRFALAPLGLDAPRMLTLDAPRTALELAKHLSYATVLVVAHELARSPAPRGRLLAGVGLCGAAIALSGLLHALFGAQALLGAVHFRDAAPPLLTPFGNANHLAGYLTLSGAALAGLWSEERVKPRRWLWAVAFVLCAAGVALSLSRAGICFFALSLGLWASLRRERRGLVLAGLATGIALGALVVWERLLEDYGALSRLGMGGSKLGAWPDLWRAALAFPAGMGRGAFALGFARFQERLTSATVTHAESAPLHLAAELGPVVGLALCAIAAVLLVRALLARRDSPRELAALCGVLGLTLHNLFDFSLELPAAASAASVVLGASALRARAAGATTARLNLAAALVLAVSAPLVALLAGGQYEAAEARLIAMRGAPASQVRPTALRLIARHPADHALYVEVAAAYVTDPRAPPDQALAFLNRALWLRPGDAAAHLWTARALVRLGRVAQALGAYRQAHEAGLPDRYLLEEALPRATDTTGLARLVPDELRIQREVLSALLVRGAATQGLAWLESLPEAPVDPTAGLDALVARALRESGRAADALAHAERGMKRVGPAGEVEPLVLEQAAALRALGREGEARARLEARLDAEPRAVAVALALATQHIEARRFAEGRAALERARATSATERARILQMEAASYTHEGRKRRALESLEWVTRVVPEWPDPWLAVATALEELGRYGEAAEAVRQAQARLSPERRAASEAWLARLASKQQAAGGQGEREAPAPAP